MIWVEFERLENHHWKPIKVISYVKSRQIVSFSTYTTVKDKFFLKLLKNALKLICTWRNVRFTISTDVLHGFTNNRLKVERRNAAWISLCLILGFVINFVWIRYDYKLSEILRTNFRSVSYEIEQDFRRRTSEIISVRAQDE